jgi:hypothetical protein
MADLLARPGNPNDPPLSLSQTLVNKNTSVLAGWSGGRWDGGLKKAPAGGGSLRGEKLRSSGREIESA